MNMSWSPTIFLFADVLGGIGGIETYLNALARRLVDDCWPIRATVCLNSPAPFLTDLEKIGVPVFRQPRIPGDRWQIRQRLLVRHVAGRVQPGDWVYCVRQPMPEIYLSLVRAVHASGGKVAVSWMFAPEFLPPPPGRVGNDFRQAVAETDVVVSVAKCTKRQFREQYGYVGPVAVIRYHNIELFDAPAPLPPWPPFGIGYIGRIDIDQKNLDTILASCRLLAKLRADVVFNFHGGGPDLDRLRGMVAEVGLGDRVAIHGSYDHRRDLPAIIAANHVFVHTSRYEGGPCLALVELLQAGRYVVTSPVGGIPDIYEGRPAIGELVPPNNPMEMADAFDRAITRIAQGAVDPAAIRAVYEREFRERVAHRQWLEALDLAEPARVAARQPV
jgi:glycosyltransferase involved in cell wall biosynthesis